MLLLFTPEVITHQHLPILKEALQYVDKLHVKTSSTSKKELQNLIEKIIFDNISSKEKIVIHNSEIPITDYLNPKETEIFFNENLVKNVHFSEKFYQDYQKNISTDFYRKYNVSTSVHHLDIDDSYSKFSYLIYGPVFTSISKLNYTPQESLEDMNLKLNKINKIMKIPIIGIGGITENNFQKVIETGFSGVALRGYIWQSNDPLKTLNEFVKRWEKNKDQ